MKMFSNVGIINAFVEKKNVCIHGILCTNVSFVVLSQRIECIICGYVAELWILS